jgi:DNA uptake protein ComE-like DNA-binding protein
MKSFFRFTAGEWAASALMGILIIAGIFFYYLYENSAVAHTDYTKYKEMFAQFEQEQQRLADSVEAARKWRNRHTKAYSGDSASDAGGMAEPYRQDSYFSHDDKQYQHHGHSPVETRHGTSLQHTNDSLRKQPQKPQYAIVKVDLNRADTSDVMRIPGFGSKRAQKIVEYRDKLGGFYSLAQLKEIYILQNIKLEYVEKYFTADRQLIRKININQCDYKTLIAHPYFDSYLTKTILNYRQQNGPIRDIAHLRNITHIYAELEEKLQWYVEF